MKKQNILILVLAFVSTFSIRVYWLSQKDGLFVDEGLSVSFASNNGYMWGKNYDYKRTYTGEELKKISLGTGNNSKTLSNDLFHLWKNSGDPTHTNYYYSLLRIFLSGEKSGNVDKIITRAGMLNLLLFSISFFSFFLFLRYVFNNDFISLIGCFCVFITPVTISNTLFFREYQLQETMLFLLLLISAFVINSLIHNRGAGKNTLFITLFSLCCALFLLASYFSIVFIALSSLFLVFQKSSKLFFRPNIFNLTLLTIFFVSIIYPIFFSTMILSLLSFLKYGGYGENITPPFSGFEFFTKIYNSLTLNIRMISNQFFSIMAYCSVFASVLYLIISRTKIAFKLIPFWISIISFISIIIIMFCAPFRTIRYIMPFSTLLILYPLVLLQSIKKRLILYLFSFLFCFAFAINSFSKDSFDNEYHRIDNILNDGKLLYVFALEEKIPVILYNKSNWEYGGLVPYMNDNQNYIFIDDMKYLSEVTPDTFYLLISKSSENMYFARENISDIKIASEYNYVPRFYCYKMEKNIK